MAASITIERKIPELFGSPQELQGYIMRVEVTGSTDMEEEIFVWQSRVPFGENNLIDQFINVASPNDIEEVPVGTISTDDNPYFRTKQLELTFRSQVELEETWEYIKEDIQGLVAALNSLSTLATVEEVTIQ